MSFKKMRMMLFALLMTASFIMSPIQSAYAATLNDVISGGEEGVAPGYSAQMSVSVEAEEGEDASVSWSISGASSPATSISSRGMLTIGLDESAASITVTAVLNVDPAQIATTDVAINYPEEPEPEPEITSVDLGRIGAMDAGSSATLAAKVNGTGDYDDGIVWALSGNTSADTTISADGVLKVGIDELGPVITVTAIASGDPTISASIDVDIIPAPAPEPVVYQVVITSGTTSIRAGQSAEYRAKANGANGFDETVSWSVTGAKSGSTFITSDGILTVGADEKSEKITVIAASNQDSSVVGTREVNVTINQEKPEDSEQPQRSEEQTTKSTTDFIEGTQKTETSVGDKTSKSEETVTEQKQEESKQEEQKKPEETKKNEDKKEEKTEEKAPSQENGADIAGRISEQINKAAEEIRKQAGKTTEPAEQEAKPEDAEKPESKDEKAEDKAKTENVAEENGSVQTADDNVLYYSFGAFAIAAVMAAIIAKTRKKAIKE